MTLIPRNIHPRPDMYGTIRILVLNYTNDWYKRESIHAEAATRGEKAHTPELDEQLINDSIRICWHLRQFVGVIPAQN